jgi:hypothetical protein
MRGENPNNLGHVSPAHRRILVRRVSSYAPKRFQPSPCVHQMERVACDMPPCCVPPERLVGLDTMFDRLQACHDSSRNTPL